MIKLKWKVGTPWEGPYRSFHKRSWPSATFAHCDKMAAQITCEDSYEPPRVRTGNHAELIVWIANHNPPPEKDTGAWEWRRLKKRCATLEEAKALAVAALEAHPEFLPV